jgi:hypothetical protein
MAAMPRLRTYIRHLLWTISTVVLVPILGDFFIQIARDKGLYIGPTHWAGRAMTWLSELAQSHNFQLASCLIIGLTAGVWLDVALSRGGRHFFRREEGGQDGREPSETENRLYIKERLGEALRTASLLTAECKTTENPKDLESRMSAHLTETYNFINASLGKGEAVLFNNGSGLVVYSSGGANQDLKNGMEYRIQRLAQLLQRVDSLSINPEFRAPLQNSN